MNIIDRASALLSRYSMSDEDDAGGWFMCFVLKWCFDVTKCVHIAMVIV